MPRQARLDAPGALHHVRGRGIEGISMRWRKRVMDLKALLREVAKREGLGEEEVMGRSWRELMVRGRKVFCQVAVRKLEYTGASVARFLGMTTSSVNRMAILEEMTELDAWDK